MTSTADIAARLEEWAAAELGINTFPDDPNDLDEALPLVICDIQRRRRTKDDGGFGAYQHEQTALRLWNARLTVMVGQSPSWDKTIELYDFTDDLEEALKRDRTLGGRVEASSLEVSVEYPGELEHDSGTVARGAFFDMTVGETTEV